MPLPRAVLRVAVAGLVLAGCADQSVPVAPATIAPDGSPAAAPAAPSRSAALLCRADVAAMKVSCGDEGASGGASRGLITLGGQNIYVKLTSTNLLYNAGTGAFTFDVTVQNLIPQPMGTTDGATGDGVGLKVFFQTPPTGIGGAVTITNASGTGTFTGTNQSYFLYPGTLLGGDGILSQNETTSAKNWAFNVPASVTSFTFAVYVNTNVQHSDGYIDVTPSAASVIASGSQALVATVRSPGGNTIPGQTVTWGSSTASVATVASDGTVTAVAPGTATITATSGLRSGATTISVCPNLALGGVSVITGPTAAGFCLAGQSGNEYVVVPHNGDPTSALTVSVTGSGITPASGAPTPYIGGAPASLDVFTPRVDLAAETRLRQMERDLDPMIPAARAIMASRSRSATRGLVPQGPSRSITPGTPVVGQQMTLNVNSSSACAVATNATATVKSVGTRSVIMAQDDNNQTNTFTQAEYDAFATSFDNVIWPLITGAFGVPTDIDNNGGRIVILFTRAVNQLTAPGSSSYTGGFVFSRDLFPTAGSPTLPACATSNVGEMFYMLAPDSTGIDGNVRTASFVKGVTTGTLAHEFQHLINASRRFYVNSASGSETIWLNEGLSHISEELLFNQVAGFTPGSGINLAAIIPQPTQNYFFTYAEANFGRYRTWLLSPETSSPVQLADGLPMRGAIWSFLRYAADRQVPAPGDQTPFFRALVNSTTNGTANLTTVLGTSVTPWFRDFAAAVYASDMGVGTVASTYRMPSWNFRSIYGGLNYGPGAGFPLTVRNPATGVPSSATLAYGGGASYVRMGVPATTFARVTVTKSGGGALPSSLSVLVIRRK